MAGPILYLSGTLPARSETFVYREIQALRELGVEVVTASVHAPSHGLGAAELEEMANETIEIYSRGMLFLLGDAVSEFLVRPVRAVMTLAQAAFDALLSKDVRLTRIPKVMWQGVAGLALAKRVHRKGIGVVHVHSHMAHVPTTIAMYAARQLGITFSFTGHAIDLFPERTLLKEKLQRALFVNCISLWHRAFYKGIVKRDDSDLPIIRCGVDTRKYHANEPPSMDTLEVLGVGRLVEKKGFDVLIQAAIELSRAQQCRIHVTIVGGGPEEIRLKAMVDQLPGSTPIVELLGEVDNDAVMNLMGRADVFALPCRVTASGDRDGIPVVLMEAMARGRCVISGDLETIRELVVDEVTGILIPPGNRTELILALKELSGDRDRIHRLGRAGRARVEAEFDLVTNARRILEALSMHGVPVTGNDPADSSPERAGRPER